LIVGSRQRSLRKVQQSTGQFQPGTVCHLTTAYRAPGMADVASTSSPRFVTALDRGVCRSDSKPARSQSSSATLMYPEYVGLSREANSIDPDPDIAAYGRNAHRPRCDQIVIEWPSAQLPAPIRVATGVSRNLNLSGNSMDRMWKITMFAAALLSGVAGTGVAAGAGGAGGGGKGAAIAPAGNSGSAPVAPASRGGPGPSREPGVGPNPTTPGLANRPGCGAAAGTGGGVGQNSIASGAGALQGANTSPSAGGGSQSEQTKSDLNQIQRQANDMAASVGDRVASQSPVGSSGGQVQSPQGERQNQSTQAATGRGC
jgi:hypothetical protein